MCGTAGQFFSASQCLGPQRLAPHPSVDVLTIDDLGLRALSDELIDLYAILRERAGMLSFHLVGQSR